MNNLAMKTVLIVGATGGTGRCLVRAARNAGLRVRCLTSVPAKLTILREMGVDDVVVGDLRAEGIAERAVTRVHAVLSAVGGADVFRDGVTRLIAATEAMGAAPFVLETALGVGTARGAIPPERYEILRLALEAMDVAEAALRSSGLVYTILRPGRLLDEPASGDVLVGEGGTRLGGGSIPRADVARLMVAALVTPEAYNRTFEIVSRAGFRGGAGETVDAPWRFPEPGQRSDPTLA